MQRTVFSKYYDESLVYNHMLVSQNDSREILPHSHTTYELFYLKKGLISYTENGKKYTLHNDSLIFSRPGNMHSIIFESDSYERYNIIFDKECIYPHLTAKIPDSIITLNCKNFPQFGSLFEKMDIYYRCFRDNDLKHILINIVEELFYNMIALEIVSEGSGNVTETYTENPIVSAAVAYIDENINDHLLLDELCERLHITKSYLHQLFTSYLHISPKKYINSKKLTAAQASIRLGSNPTDVYALYGYTDYTTFYRGYKKHFGYSPSEEISHYLSKNSLS